MPSLLQARCSLKLISLAVLAFAITLCGQTVASAQTGGSGTKMGVPYKWVNCGNATPQARSAKSIGYDGVRPLKCGSARKIVRKWTRLDRCGTDVGDQCRFAGWHCTVGTALRRPTKRVVGCNRSSLRAITFTSRYR